MDIAQYQSSEITALPRKTHKDLIVGKRESFKALLPKGIDVMSFERGVLAAFVKNKGLRQCSETSILMAISACAELGLIPNGALGHAYLVPFKGECQFIVGYKGMISLARRSGEIESISVRKVYASDQFVLEYGLHERCEHKPSPGDRGEFTGVYCVARFRGGGHHLEYMSVQDVLSVKNSIKTRNGSPWVSNFEEMAAKTVIRRAWKLWPCSTEMAKAMQLEDDQDDRDDQDGGKEDGNEIEEMTGEEYVTE